jgi:hypothetical protein
MVMGISFGGLFKALINPTTLMQLAMGPAGWASIAMKAVIQQVAMQVIQQIGEKIGLPPALISAAQMAYNQSANAGGGGFPGLNANGFEPRALTSYLMTQGMSATDAGQFVRDIQQQAQQAQTQELKGSVQDFINQLNRDAENKKTNRNVEQIMNGKGSLLMKLATALGMLADQKMNEMADKTKELGKFGEVTGKNQGKYGELTGQIQGLGQEMSMLSNAMSNVIKTIGEAASTIARKG